MTVDAEEGAHHRILDFCNNTSVKPDIVNGFLGAFGYISYQGSNEDSRPCGTTTGQF